MVPAGDVVRGLAPTRTVLANGTVVLAKRTRKTPAVAINVALRAGSVCDVAEAAGASFLLGRVIDRGTAKRSAEEIAEEFDNRGISLTVTVTRHVFSLGCTCLAEDFRSALGLIGEIVAAPSIPEAELTTRKSEVVTAIRQDADSPAVRAVESLMAMLYGPAHPYGRPVKGTVDSVERLSRADLLRVHADYFAAAGASVVVVGDVDPGEVVEATDAASAAWRVAGQPLPPLPPIPAVPARRRVVIPMMNKAQADIAYGLTAITRADPAYYACWLMNVVLGQYAMGGRLGDNIRERQGMAYYASSTLEASVAPGPFVVRAGVSADNVDRAIHAIDDELTGLVARGVTPQELDEARQYLIGSMPRMLETNDGIAAFLQNAQFFGLGDDYDARLPSLLTSVTLDDVHQAARRVLDPERATIVIAGPYAGT